MTEPCSEENCQRICCSTYRPRATKWSDASKALDRANAKTRRSAGKGSVEWDGYLATLSSDLQLIWEAVEVLAASGVIVGRHYETGAGPTNATGASGIERLHEVLRGERPSGA